jgi:uncharacterized membrane protein YdjX (TVP38/TMEM64 family)
MSKTISTFSTAAWLPTTRRRVLVIILLAVSLALATSFAALHDWVVGLLPVAERVIREQSVLGVVVFVAFAALSAMLAFVSSAVIVPVGVYVWGKLASMFLLWLGWILGGITAYTLSRYFGRAVVQVLVPRRLFERYESLVPRRAAFGSVLLLQLALPSEVPGYLLGLTRYAFWRYVATLALAELPYAVATVYLGAGFIERRIYLLIGVGIAVAVLAGVALHALHQQIAKGKFKDT